MAKHTPGPWIVGTDRRYPTEPCIDAVVDGVVWHVALCHTGLGPDEGSGEANARLIAAAPDLYSCLKDVLPVLRGEYERLASVHSGMASDKVTPFSKAEARYRAALAALEKAEGLRPTHRRNGSAQVRRQ